MSEPTCHESLRRLRGRLTVLLALGLAACQVACTGSGAMRNPNKPVAFTWQSHGQGSGEMEATFGNGRVFKGTYLRISDDLEAERLAPLWDGWGDSPSRGHWRHWQRNPGSKFFEAYRGDVLANLHASNGEHLRCRFTLNSASRGMAGGGDGRCQLSDTGQEISADFRRQGPKT